MGKPSHKAPYRELPNEEQLPPSPDPSVRARPLSEAELDERFGELPYEGPDHDRPKTRADCVDSPRPCPYVSCRYHLYLDVEGKLLKVFYPDRDFDEIPATCALDIADRGGQNLEEIGGYFNLTRERIRQIENTALRKLRFYLKGDSFNEAAFHEFAFMQYERSQGLREPFQPTPSEPSWVTKARDKMDEEDTPQGVLAVLMISASEQEDPWCDECARELAVSAIAPGCPARVVARAISVDLDELESWADES